MYFYEKNKLTLPFEKIEEIQSYDSIFIIFNDKKIGFKRSGKFFIDNTTIDLKINVSNYEMNILKSKTMEHNLLLNCSNINSYNIGYSLKNNNEYFEFIVKVNTNKIFIYTLRNINGLSEEKILPLEVK